jgi:single-stranded DNA-specific DHH superfamily exonuclease
MVQQVFDVCNGDADGLCAVLQWRLHAPAAATLVTGLKRELSLLERVAARAGDEVNVFDLSMQRNHAALLRLLDAGVRVRYFDHHAPPELPAHALLEAHIDCGSEVCTSLLVDRHIGGALRAWALVGAYGDNLAQVADPLALAAGFGEGDRRRLRRLGEAINYNAYGDDEQDVFIPPARLHAILSRYGDPRDMLAHEGIADEIDALRRADLRQAISRPPCWQDAGGSVLVLPDEAWSRRVLGCLANELANAEPQRAHAVLTLQRGGGYAVSVRSPLARPGGAHELCSRFGGGGRALAAGIDGLPEADLDRFVAAFAAADWGGG